MAEQHAARLRLQRIRMEEHQVIAEGALLFVIDPVGLQHVVPTLCARHDERQGWRGA